MTDSNYRLSATRYYADFVTVPLAILAACIFGNQLASEAFVSSVMAGVLTWSLAEYWIHRSLFHGVEPFKAEHRVHHIRPPDYIGASPWLTAAVIAVGGPVAFASLGSTVGAGFFAGILTGYFAYIFVHDRFHHARGLGPVLAWLHARHEYHHRRERVNFGVTSPLWDLAFGTYARPHALERRR